MLKRKPRGGAALYPARTTFETETYEMAGFSSYASAYGDSAAAGASAAGPSGSSSAAAASGSGPRGGAPMTGESRVDRLRRLRWEVDQLEKETQAAAASAAAEAQSEEDAGAALPEATEASGSSQQASGPRENGSGSASSSKKKKKNEDEAVPPAALLAQLSLLSDSLARVEAAPHDAAASSRAGAEGGESGSTTEWRRTTQALLRDLKDAQALADSRQQRQESAGEEAKGRAGAAALLVPPHQPGDDAGSLVRLEGQVTELESFVGVKDLLVDEVSRLRLVSVSRA